MAARLDPGTTAHAMRAYRVAQRQLAPIAPPIRRNEGKAEPMANIEREPAVAPKNKNRHTCRVAPYAAGQPDRCSEEATDLSPYPAHGSSPNSRSNSRAKGSVPATPVWRNPRAR